ncbi:hypothetical protein P152DRAFT_394057, partial [Eremomyces bilateralis CBS 781.70]
HRSDAPRFPCLHCNRYSGVNAFKRKDHLESHLRSFHGIGVTSVGYSCHHMDCKEFRLDRLHPDFKGHAFNTSSEYARHMRHIHDESPYPCPINGCSRVGGYFSKKSLVQHVKKEHPEANLDFETIVPLFQSQSRN